jgi:hypothetical protein
MSALASKRWRCWTHNGSGTRLTREDDWRTVLLKDRVEIGNSGEMSVRANPDKRPTTCENSLTVCRAPAGHGELLHLLRHEAGRV